MFREFIRWALGPLGREVLSFYTDYNAIINILVLVYGLILFVPHYILRRTIHRIEHMMLKLASRLDEPIDFEALAENLSHDWESLASGQSIILPTKNDLWFEVISRTSLFDLLQLDADYVRIALHKQTGYPRLRDFKAANFQLWEKYRRQLLKGVRGYTPSEIKRIRKQQNVQ